MPAIIVPTACTEDILQVSLRRGVIGRRRTNECRPWRNLHIVPKFQILYKGRCLYQRLDGEGLENHIRYGVAGQKNRWNDLG